MHYMDRITDLSSLWDEDFTLAIRATSSRQRCIFVGIPVIPWDSWEESKGFVQGVLEICTIFQFLERDISARNAFLVCSKFVEDDVTQFLVEFWIPSELMECPA